jgi:hypothetical protein
LLLPYAVAEICTGVLADTGAVTTWNVAEVLPAGTTILAGIDETAAPPLTTASVTVVSDGTAGEKFTLPVLLPPPVTEVGENVTDTGTFGVTVSVPALLPPLAVAVMETGVEAVTVVVVTGNVADVAPCGTVTLTGIEDIAEAFVAIAKATTVSEVTGRLNVTFPVLPAPAFTETGTKETALGQFGLTVSFPVLLLP